MTKDEALRLALEALELVNIEFVCGNGSHNAKKDRHEWDETCPITDRWQKAIAAIKEALAQPEQEPVAWWNDTGTHIDLNVSGRGTPLYTTPPQRTWVELTDEELSILGESFTHLDEGIDEVDFGMEIQRILKEKNT